MEIDEIKPGEFAVRTRAEFKATTQVIKMSDKGVLSITLTYVLSDLTAIQTESGPISTTIGDSGIFDKATKIEFEDPGSSPATFALDFNREDNTIFLESDKAGFLLNTEAKKGRQGNAILKRKKSLKSSDQ